MRAFGSIKARVGGGFVVVLMLTAAVAVIGWVGLDSYRSGVSQTRQYQTLLDAFQQTRVAVRDFRVSPDEITEERVQSALATVTALADALHADGDSAGTMVDVRRSIESYAAAFADLARLEAEKTVALEAMQQRQSALQDAARAIVDAQEHVLATLADDDEAAQAAAARALAVAESAQVLVTALATARADEQSFVRTGSPAARDAAVTGSARIQALAREIAEAAGSDDQADLARQIVEAVATHGAELEQVIQVVDAFEVQEAQVAEAEAVLESSAGSVQALSGQFADTIATAERAAEASQVEADDALSRGRMLATGANRFQLLTAQAGRLVAEYRLAGTEDAANALRATVRQIAPLLRIVAGDDSAAAVDGEALTALLEDFGVGVEDLIGAYEVRSAALVTGEDAAVGAADAVLARQTAALSEMLDQLSAEAQAIATAVNAQTLALGRQSDTAVLVRLTSQARMLDIERMLNALAELRMLEQAYIRTGDARLVELANDRIGQAVGIAESIRTQLRADDEIALVDSLLADFTAYEQAFTTVVEAISDRARGQINLSALIGDMQASAGTIEEMAGRFEAERDAESDAFQAEAAAARAAREQGRANAIEAEALIRLSLEAAASVPDAMAGDPAAREVVERDLSQLQATAASLGEHLTDTNSQAHLAAILDAAETYRVGFETVLTRIDDQDRAMVDMDMADQDASLAVGDAERTIRTEMAAAGERQSRLIMLGAMAAIIVGAVLAFVIGRAVATPIGRMSGIMRRMAGGDYDVEVSTQRQATEMTRMAEALQVFQANAREMEHMRVAQKEAEERAASERRETVERLADSFEETVVAAIAQVTAMARDMNDQAQSMSALATQTDSQSGSAASSATEVNAGAEAIGQRVEAMVALLDEVASRVDRSRTLSSTATQKVEEAGRTITALAEASETIGSILTLIETIADQTSLLALNATIEAARAGEAGRGFAVVASEVKSLSRQTSEATGRIDQEVMQVRSRIEDAVVAVDAIRDVVGEVEQTSGDVSAAVEEQNTAAHEISDSIGHIVTAVGEIVHSIEEVRIASGRTGESATRIRVASDTLKEQATVLGNEATRFNGGMRAT